MADLTATFIMYIADFCQLGINQPAASKMQNLETA
jgi:hypothetical protein